MKKTLKNTNNFENYKKTRGEYYYCYSPNQYVYLIELGFTPNHRGLHAKTKKVFWAFSFTDKLSKALTDWTLKRRVIIE